MCLALGYEHPDLLLQNLTADQMSEWEAFNRIQPIGTRRMDVYFSYLMASVHNIAIAFSGSKGAKQFKTEDFVPNWTGIEAEPDAMTPEAMKAFWIAFAEENNKKVREKELKKTRQPKKEQT